MIFRAAVRTFQVLLGTRSSKWPKVRTQHLKDNPTCAACGGKKILEVHHIEPFHVNKERELDPNNLITLCDAAGHSCHFVFGHCHSWSAWNPRVVEDAATHLHRVRTRLGGP